MLGTIIIISRSDQPRCGKVAARMDCSSTAHILEEDRELRCQVRIGGGRALLVRQPAQELDKLHPHPHPPPHARACMRLQSTDACSRDHAWREWRGTHCPQSMILVQMWQGKGRSRCRCGRASQVVAQMWQERGETCGSVISVRSCSFAVEGLCTFVSRFITVWTAPLPWGQHHFQSTGEYPDCPQSVQSTREYRAF